MWCAELCCAPSASPAIAFVILQLGPDRSKVGPSKPVIPPQPHPICLEALFIFSSFYYVVKRNCYIIFSGEIQK